MHAGNATIIMHGNHKDYHKEKRIMLIHVNKEKRKAKKKPCISIRSIVFFFFLCVPSWTTKPRCLGGDNTVESATLYHALAWCPWVVGPGNREPSFLCQKWLNRGSLFRSQRNLVRDDCTELEGPTQSQFSEGRVVEYRQG